MNESFFKFDIAEVVDTTNTYKSKRHKLKLKSVNTYTDRDEFDAIPANNNNKQIPLKGELVLVVYGPYNPDVNKSLPIAYYLSSIDLLSSISYNGVIGMSNEHYDKLDQETINNTPAGETFDKTNKVLKLQPYEGDTIIESRFGSSIRFGSTLKNAENYYSIQPPWSGENVNDPITIISNKRPIANNGKFVTENINTDGSSIYLTSTQTVPFTLTKTLTRTRNFTGSQLLGASDRIILSAKTDIAVIDAKTEIVLNTEGEILLGGDDAQQPIPHGDILKDILEKIMLILGSGYIDSAGGCTSLSGAARDILSLAQKKLETLNSTKYKIKETE
jgi:hypothetical protein